MQSDPPIPDQPVVPDLPTPGTPTDVPDVGTPEPEPDQPPRDQRAPAGTRGTVRRRDGSTRDAFAMERWRRHRPTLVIERSVAGA